MQEQNNITVKHQITFKEGQEDKRDRNQDASEIQHNETDRSVDTTEQDQNKRIDKYEHKQDTSEQTKQDETDRNIDGFEEGQRERRDKYQHVGEQGQGDVSQTDIDMALKGHGAERDIDHCVCEKGQRDSDRCVSEQGQRDSGVTSQTVSCENESSLGGPTFDPPLYVQRYGFVREVLEKRLVKSVVDFGSAQCKIITLLKTVPCLERIALVDKNGHLLNANRWNALPLLGDYLHPRADPLVVHLFEGSAAMLDQRIVGYEAATMIELIEHLYEDELSEVCQCVFGSLEPRLVIVTTPNRDFNQLFTNFEGMRHWDHKFEWSQQQFNTWCQSICEKFEYQVEITGVGEGPPGSENLGFCTQAAIFTQNSSSSSIDPKGSLCYRLIQSKEFPFKKNCGSLEDCLAAEVAYHLHKIARYPESDLDRTNTVCVPLTQLLRCKSIHELCGLEKLREFVSRHYTLAGDEDCVLYVLEEENSFDSDIESDFDSEDPQEKQEICEFMSHEESWD